ncbi:hypothetical protein MCHI_000756 [Candidatus Magnetoovum chiemensis]|nr:hypothetical protein MCHI_000756 [Candidatus Magnetoovum chiemensis]
MFCQYKRIKNLINNKINPMNARQSNRLLEEVRFRVKVFCYAHFAE